MSFSTFTPPDVDAGIESATELRLIGSEFGSVYGDLDGDANDRLQIVKVSWTDLDPDEAATMDAFFRGLQGARFLWTKPRESTTRLWRCKDWTLSERIASSDFEATLEEQPQ